MNIKRALLISIVLVVLVLSLTAVSADLFGGVGSDLYHPKAELVISEGSPFISDALSEYDNVPSDTVDWCLDFDDLNNTCYMVTSCDGYEGNISRVIVVNDEISLIDDDYYLDSDFRPLKIKCDVIETRPLGDGSEIAFVKNAEFVEWV